MEVMGKGPYSEGTANASALRQESTWCVNRPVWLGKSEWEGEWWQVRSGGKEGIAHSVDLGVWVCVIRGETCGLHFRSLSPLAEGDRG